MNWDLIGSIAELVGAAAVVVALLYLANQVKDAVRESRSNRRGDLNRDVSHVPDSWCGNTELSDIVYRGLIDPKSLRGQETFRFYGSLYALFRAWEALFQDSQEETAARWGPDAARSALVDLLGFPGTQRYWQHRRHWYTDSFQAEIDKLLEETLPVMRYDYELADQTSKAKLEE